MSDFIFSSVLRLLLIYLKYANKTSILWIWLILLSLLGEFHLKAFICAAVNLWWWYHLGQLVNPVLCKSVLSLIVHSSYFAYHLYSSNSNILSLLLNYVNLSPVKTEYVGESSKAILLPASSFLSTSFCPLQRKVSLI